MTFLKSLKNRVYLLIYLLCNLQKLKEHIQDSDLLANNSIIILSKKGINNLFKLISEENSKIKLITFFDLDETNSNIMNFSELWTNSVSDEKIHKAVQTSLMLEPNDFKYVFYYEKKLQEEKIKFINNYWEEYRCVFCFSYEQFFQGLSLFRVLKVGYHFVYVSKKRVFKLKIENITKNKNIVKLIKQKARKILVQKIVDLVLWLNIGGKQKFKNFNKLKHFIPHVSTFSAVLYFLHRIQMSWLRKNIMAPNTIALVLATGLWNRKHYKATVNTIASFNEQNLRPIVITPHIFIYFKLLFKKCHVIFLFLNARQLMRKEDLALGEEMYYVNGYERYSQFLLQIAQAVRIKDIVLLPHWSYLGFCFLKVAKEISAKTYSFPLVSVSPHISSIIGWKNIDYIFCYGTQCQDSFLHLGHQRTLINAGNVSYARQDLKTGKNNSGLLIATSNIDKQETIWMEAVLHYCQENNIKCYINVHPSFSTKIYSSLLKRKMKNVKILKTNNILKLLKKCAVCITDCSTVGAEAIFLRKFLLTVNLTGKAFPANNYNEYGVALHAKSLEEVPHYLNLLFNNDETRRSLESNYEKFYHLFNYKNDGQASKRVVEFILNQTQSQLNWVV